VIDTPEPASPTPTSTETTPTAETPVTATPVTATPVTATPVTPTAIGRPTPASTPTRTPTDPSRFGRIAADGTAYLTTGEGEIVIGQWAAGTHSEGMAFFGRKYDDLFIELDLARTRLIDGRATPEQAKTALEHLRAAIAAPMFMGDLDALRAACDSLEGEIAAAHEASARRREEARAAARQERETIVIEAEALAESTRWKATGDRFAELLESWKAAPRIDRGTEQALWKRFSAARATFDRARRAHFTERDAARKEVVAAKERIIAKARELSGSTDWAGTTREYRRLLDQWKAAGSAGRGPEDRLWEQFRAAQDVFFAARDASNAERDGVERENLRLKTELVAEAEALLPITDIGSAKKAMRSIADRWDAIGHVPRNDRDRVEGRLRRVEQAIRDREQDHWRRSNPETRARAHDTVGKFREALAKAERARDAAQARGDSAAVRKAEESIESTRLLLEAAEGALSEFSR
jgi:hypothetical protein